MSIVGKYISAKKGKNEIRGQVIERLKKNGYHYYRLRLDDGSWSDLISADWSMQPAERPKSDVDYQPLEERKKITVELNKMGKTVIKENGKTIAEQG